MQFARPFLSKRQRIVEVRHGLPACATHDCPGFVLGLAVYLRESLPLAVPADAGHLLTAPGRDVQAGFCFACRLVGPRVEGQLAFDIDAIALPCLGRDAFSCRAKAGDAKPLRNVAAIVGLPDRHNNIHRHPWSLRREKA